MVAAWEDTTAYCASFVFAVQGQQNLAVNTGKSCLDRRGRVLTETDGPLGPVVDIRLPGEAWYYDPARPVVVHLVAHQATPDPAELAGTGIGEWVAQLAEAPAFTVLPDRSVADRPHWLVSFPARDVQGEVVLFIDQEHRLPTAVELRQDGRALLSSGYTELVLNPQLPESTFRIRPLFNVPTVEVAWDPTVSPAVAAEGLR